MQRITLAASSVAICAAMTAGCGALHDAPISNARANKNVATKSATPRSDSVDTQRLDKAKRDAYDAARKEAASKAKEAKKEAVDTKNTKADSGGDMALVTQTSDVPAWAIAINWAQGKLGHKYVWGGDGYDNPYDGFDCSGLMKAAYAQAGIRLPRVARDQYYATNIHPKESELRPGDLVFFGTSRNIHHVGMYVGQDDQGRSMMLHAPNSRKRIQFNPVHYMNDYFGATRVSP